MGLYNILFGVNPNYEQILTALNLTKEEVPRFRDAYLTEREGKQVIAIHTRMGTGNRGHWDYDSDTNEGIECKCNGCRAQYGLAQHPAYIADEDDNFDYTYATYYFQMPNHLTGESSTTPAEKWNAFLENHPSDDNPTP